MRGKLIGHRIKYWRKDLNETTESQYLLSRSVKPRSLIIGLQPNAYYWVRKYILSVTEYNKNFYCVLMSSTRLHTYLYFRYVLWHIILLDLDPSRKGFLKEHLNYDPKSRRLQFRYIVNNYHLIFLNFYIIYLY